MWYNKKPILAHIKIWSCLAYVKRIESDKLGAKSDKCLFLEFPKGYMPAIILKYRKYLSNNKILHIF